MVDNETITKKEIIEATEEVSHSENQQSKIDLEIENNNLKQQLNELNLIIGNMNNTIREQDKIITHYKLIAEIYYNNIKGDKHE